MEMIPENYSQLYFRKKQSTQQSALKMDATMLQVLFSIDVSKNIPRIAKETGIDTSVLKNTLTKLLKLQLIEVVTNDVAFLDNAFLSILTQNLTQVVGPIASILIEDVAESMGFSVSTIPIRSAVAFVKTIATEIPEKESRVRFQQSMAGKIPKEKI